MSFSILPNFPLEYKSFSILPNFPLEYKSFSILPNFPLEYKSFSSIFILALIDCDTYLWHVVRLVLYYNEIPFLEFNVQVCKGLCL